MSINIKFLRSAICMFLFVVLYPFPASSAPLDNWHVRNSVPGGYTLNAVAYGNGMFVAAGSGGTILSSPDGTNWTARTSGTSHDLNGVTFANGMFVAVGGEPYIFGYPVQMVLLTSSDGIDWNIRINTGIYDALRGVAYGNGLFVAGGSSLLISQDGATWNFISPVISSPWPGISGITMGDGVFVAGSGPFIITSSDGQAWTERTVEADTVEFRGLAHGANAFVAVGIDFGGAPSPIVFFSPDGLVWSRATIGTSRFLAGITFGANNFIAVGDFGTVASSPDGLNWTMRPAGTSEWLRGVAYGNRTFVSVGQNGIIIQSDPQIEAVGVPTFSEWGVILLVLSCGVAAVRFLRISKS